MLFIFMCLNRMYDNGISIKPIFMISMIMFNGSGKNKPVIKKAMVELDGMCTSLVFLLLSVLETSVTSLFKVILFATKRNSSLIIYT